MEKNIIESFKLATARNNIGIYGQRLILLLMELAREEGSTKGFNLKLEKGLRKVEVVDWGARLVTLPFTDIIGDSENYDAVKNSIRALQKEIIEYQEEDGTWVEFPILSTVRMNKKTVTVKVNGLLWKVLQGDLPLQ